MYFDTFEECFERCKIFTAEMKKTCDKTTNQDEAYRELTSKNSWSYERPRKICQGTP